VAGAAVAAEWLAAGFTAVQAADWIAHARCFTALAAAELRDAGLTPNDAASVVPDADPDADLPDSEIDREIGIYSPVPGGETNGYLVANCDLTIDEARSVLGR